MPDWLYQPSDIQNVVAFALIAGLLVLMAMLVFRYVVETNRKRHRGFEVKLNAGEEPAVKEERDIDHG